MINFKKIIAGKIAKAINLKEEEIQEYLEIPPNSEMGDYAFPCFRLAKTLKKSPPEIATEIKEKIEFGAEIADIKNAGGYLNFYVDKMLLVKGVLTEIDEKQEKYGSSTIGNGQTILVEYSSPNIAKPFHIGHLRNTIIGRKFVQNLSIFGLSRHWN